MGDPQDLGVSMRLNGERMQEGNSREMIFGVAEVISYLSQMMTLHPGDIIATGTPPGVGMGMTPQRFLTPGDVMEAGVLGLGRQRNHVMRDG